MESPSGDELRKAFVAATDYLERYRDAINSLNVFPVPDGDTGTNMLLTMRSARERCPNTPHSSAEDVLSGLELGDEVPTQLVPHTLGLVSGCFQLGDCDGAGRCHERRLVRVRAIA